MIPRRAAHATHALMESSGPYAFGQGPRTTGKVMQYDIESLSTGSTFSALTTAMRHGLVMRTVSRPVLWYPLNKALDMKTDLEDRFLSDTENL